MAGMDDQLKARPDFLGAGRLVKKETDGLKCNSQNRLKREVIHSHRFN